jgi:sec-independent protein translocase protein TatA
MGLGWKELLIVLVIVLVVFGTKRLKNMGADLGDAVKGFKKGLNGDDASKPDAGKSDPGLPDDSRKD